MVQQRLYKLRVGWRVSCLRPEPRGQQHRNQAHIGRLRQIFECLQRLPSSCLVLGKGQQKPHCYCEMCACTRRISHF